ncbi:MAG: hypothetical protein ABR907_08820 [Terracidiphilus sp.]|jgi:hypothetical protein
MDKTLAVLLSGLGEGKFPMVVDLVGPTAQAFRHISATNPLRKLSGPDQKILYSMLKVYAAVTTQDGKRRSKDGLLEKEAKLVYDAAKLGSKLESEVFHGPNSDVLLPYISSFSDLPRQLTEFSKVVGGMLDLFGKRGHKEGNLYGFFLIVASEFVRLKTGQHYDEHLAELYQAVSERSLTEDLSGDAIRKRREYLKKSYPDLYSWMLERARTAGKSTAPRDPS